MFDFKEYIKSLLDNKEKQESVRKYIKCVENIEEIERVEDTFFYKNYISKFPTFDYLVPEEIKEDFDWVLLLQLVTSAFSAEVTVEYNEEEKGIEVSIAVQSGETKVKKKISELWSFQVLRLFEIFIEERINLEILANDEEEERIAIEEQNERCLYLARRNKLLVDKFIFLHQK